MCYSAEVSIGTFLFVAAVTAWLWQRNKGLDRPIGLILLVVSFMQLLEYILWMNLSCNWINKLVSRLIHIYLVLQPAVINLIVWFYDAGKFSGYWQLGLLSFAFVPIVAWRAQSLTTKCASLGPKGNLQWPGIPNDAWDSRLMRAFYYPALFYPILTLKNTMFSTLYGIFGIASLFIYGEKSEKSWPSLWCHFVNMLSVYAVFRGAP
jgi:hypothetical protein